MVNFRVQNFLINWKSSPVISFVFNSPITITSFFSSSTLKKLKDEEAGKKMAEFWTTQSLSPHSRRSFFRRLSSHWYSRSLSNLFFIQCNLTKTLFFFSLSEFVLNNWTWPLKLLFYVYLRDRTRRVGKIVWKEPSSAE